jgi:regulator of cell morphogenesis and NO signaling
MHAALPEHLTVGALVARHPETRNVLEKFGIDYCCGGDQTLDTAAEQKQVDPDRLRGAINEALAAGGDSETESNWLDAPPDKLVEHIEQRHHTYMKSALPRIEQLFETVLAAHGEQHGDTLQSARRVFASLKAEIEEHLWKEEHILFPYIRAAAAHAGGREEKPCLHCGTVENPVCQMRSEHDNAGHALEQLRRITSNYEPPEDACQRFRALYDELQTLEADLHEHIHLENNILFPRSIELEKAIEAAEHTGGHASTEAPEAPEGRQVDLPPAESIDLAERVEYADGSIVSRTLADSPSGTLTLFAFDAGQGLSEHSAPFDAIVQVIDGTAELTVGGRVVNAESGRTVVMPADVPHSLRAPQRCKILLIMFRSSEPGEKEE